MVRLEKIAYEKIFNNQVLHRARNITTPKKTDLFSNQYIREAPSSRILDMIFKPLKILLASYEWKFMRDNLIQRGIPFEDFMIITENEARRGILNEQANRESMHPYNFQITNWRRVGYSKVDMSLNGFEAPNYIADYVKKQTYLEMANKVLDYRHFLMSNYYADMTPISYMGSGSIVILEITIVNNLFNRSAWNRYFFNEEEYIDSRKYVADFERTVSGFGKFDLSTHSGRKDFEKFINKMNKKFPGLLAPDNEEFDFKAFYETREKNLETKDTEKFPRGILDLLITGQEEAFMVPEGEELKGKNVVGKSLPEYLNRSEKGLMQ